MQRLYSLFNISSIAYLLPNTVCCVRPRCSSPLFKLCYGAGRFWYYVVVYIWLHKCNNHKYIFKQCYRKSVYAIPTSACTTLRIPSPYQSYVLHDLTTLYLVLPNITQLVLGPVLGFFILIGMSVREYLVTHIESGCMFIIEYESKSSYEF